MASTGGPIPARMTAAEKSLVRRLHFEQGRTRTEVAKLPQRSLSSVSLLLAQKKAPKAVGWPSSLSAARVDRVAALLENMVDEADGNYKVTMAMVLRRGRFNVCERTLATAMRARGYRFRSQPPRCPFRCSRAKKGAPRSVLGWAVSGMCGGPHRN